MRNEINFFEKYHNIYFCYSNLHAFQAIALSKDNPGICYYTNAVSERKLSSDFNGEILQISEELALSYLKLSFFLKKSIKIKKNVNIYTGCMNQLTSYMACQTYINKKIYLLDDGLATYNLHIDQENAIKRKISLKKYLSSITKKIIFSFFRLIGFYDVENSKDFTQLALFSNGIENGVDLYNQLGSNGKKYIKKYKCILPAKEEKVKIASYKESLFLINNKDKDKDSDKIYLHPRVQERQKDIFLEEEILSYSKVYLSSSSLILYLIFIEYQGEIWVKEASCSYALKKFISSFNRINYY